MSRADGFLALAALVLLLALFIRCTVFCGQQVRRMKWRTRLRIRPGAGFASHWEITFRFSRLAAVYHGRRCRPDMRFTDRLICPARAYAVRLGRAQLGRKVYGRGEDQVGIIAPQRTNKTGILANRVYGHPGAAVAVTTRADLYALTSGKRAQLGPVEVFNPEGIGGIESTFRADIVADCLDPEVAIRTASALTGPVDGSGEMQFWMEKAVFAMAALMHAAALLGQDMSAVWRWSQRLGDPIKDALALPGASPELLAAAAEIQREGRAANSVRMTMARSLAWVGVPALRHAVSGTGIRPFNAARWIQDTGTLYVINSGELSAAAPLFRAVIEKIHRDCVLAGSLTPFGRIPNPAGFFLTRSPRPRRFPSPTGWPPRPGAASRCASSCTPLPSSAPGTAKTPPTRSGPWPEPRSCSAATPTPRWPGRSPRCAATTAGRWPTRSCPSPTSASSPNPAPWSWP